MKKLLIILIVLISGCSDWRDYTTPETRIEAVYLHSVGIYSVATLEGAVLSIKRLPKHSVTIYTDATDYNWYSCDYKRNGWNSANVGGCYVHIKSVDDLGTAGWTRGKFGSGTTVRVD